MILWTITILSIFGLILAGFYAWRVVQAPTCSVKDSKTQISKLKKIHSAIAEGANAFLVQEYKFMLLFIVVFSRTSLGIPDISAIPPALSETGP